MATTTSQPSPRKLERIRVVTVLMLSLLLAAPCSLLCDAQAASTATLIGNCQSVILNPDAATVNGFPAIVYFSTFDDRTDIPPLRQPSGGSFLYGGELRKRSVGVYETDYSSIKNSDGSYITYGSVVLNLPSLDSDGIGIPDFVQRDKLGTVNLTGAYTRNSPNSISVAITGTFTRNAGSASGIFSIVDVATGGSVARDSGTMEVQTYTGNFGYTRGAQNTSTLTMTRTTAGATFNLAGNTPFTVTSANQISLPQFQMTNSVDGSLYTVLATTFARTGNKYVGSLRFADGDMRTSWADNTDWAFVITDLNDSNGNGIPDLSDSPPAAPTTGGAVVAWGDNRYGQTTIPANLGEVVAIAARNIHTVSLESDGAMVAWGNNGSGQTTVPNGLTGVTSIAAGSYHTLALKSNGTVLAWGAGKTSTGVDPEFGQSIVPASLSGVTAIAAGLYHNVALKSDGTVVVWGDNTYGQTSAPADLSGVTAIAAGGYHSVALKTNGTVVAWGVNTAGQSTVPNGLNGVTAIAAGGSHTVALKTNGSVVAWGYNYFGATTVPSGLSGVTAIAAGDDHSVALKSDGTVVAWGFNYYGQTTVPAGLSGVRAIAAGSGHTVALVPLTLPIITTQPVSLTVNATSNATFGVTASGPGPLSYQWVKDGVLIAGQTSSQLNLSGLTNRASGGNISVVVSNSFGAITGNIGSVRVRVPHRLQPPVATNGMFRLLSADQDGGLLTTNDLAFFTFQTSTNLTPTNWLSITYTNGLSLTNGMLRFDDTNAASRPFRYYRVIEQ